MNSESAQPTRVSHSAARASGSGVIDLAGIGVDYLWPSVKIRPKIVKRK